MNTQPVHVGSKGNSQGIVRVPKAGKIQKFKIAHVSGGVSCSVSYRLTHFGCALANGWGLGLFITDSTKQLISPKQHQFCFYKLPCSTPDDAEFTLPYMPTPLNVINQQELQIWYGEDLFNFRESDNTGTVQIDVFSYYV